MRPEHFQAQMNRLAETFGGQHYKRERVELIWREIGSFHDSWLTRTIDRFIGELRQAPLVSEFRDAASQERERQRETQKQQEKESVARDYRFSYACDYCKDNGVYVAIHNTEKSLYGFRCHCVRGEQDPRTQIPQFKAAHAPCFTWVNAPTAGGRS